VKASTVIVRVDANTLKVIATFASRIEAERQTGIAGTKICRGLSRPTARETFGYLYGCKLLIIFKTELLVPYNSGAKKSKGLGRDLLYRRT
jgi:hypothetical protein